MGDFLGEAQIRLLSDDAQGCRLLHLVSSEDRSKMFGVIAEREEEIGC